MCIDNKTKYKKTNIKQRGWKRNLETSHSCSIDFVKLKAQFLNFIFFNTKFLNHILYNSNNKDRFIYNMNNQNWKGKEYHHLCDGTFIPWMLFVTSAERPELKG